MSDTTQQQQQHMTGKRGDIETHIETYMKNIKRRHWLVADVGGNRYGWKDCM